MSNQSINLIRWAALCTMIVIAASCAKPEIEPEKPVTKTGGPEWVLTQTTQSGSGIIYNVEIINGYLYIFSNADRPIKVKWQNLYYDQVSDPFSYWVEHPSGQPIQPYSATITISAQTSRYGNSVPNLEVSIFNNPEALPWHSTQQQIYDAKQGNRPIAPAPWEQPKPQRGWSASSFVTQYETRMYDITVKNMNYSKAP